MNNDDDFKTQLALEERERTLKEDSAATGNDPYTHIDPSDGTVYEWDHGKKAWFPKVNDDFIAAYKAAYNYEGNEDQSPKPEASSSSSSTGTSQEPQQPAQQYQSLKRKAPEQPAGWFEVEDNHNTNVYVSNLPLDITDEEFVELMSKCGLIMKDLQTNNLKYKLYTDDEGGLKGDARCCYIKVESVELALTVLDGYRLRDKEIKVERAKFQMKGNYDPTKKPKKLKQKEKKKLKQQQDKLLDWRPDKLRGERYKFEKTVIIKNMFNPEEFRKEPELILEYQSDLREECGKFGQVKKVVVYDHNPEGVASVTFNEAEEADACILALHGRWFAGKLLSAETWDGRTRYRNVETAEDEMERLKEWEQFIAKDEESKAPS